jgi:hypothetical protein
MFYKVIVTLLLFLGILLTVIDIVKIDAGLTRKEPRVIYKYIPRTFDEEQADPVPVSDIFKTMFSQPSPWVNSIRTYDIKKQENINTYFVSQL